jgi:peptide/nickel transport system ATP-binding protein
MLAIDGLKVAIDADSGLVRAIDGLTLSIERGETFALVGESGCGKSTLVRLAAGLERPERGSVRVAGIDAADRAAIPRRAIVFQDAAGSFNPRLSARLSVAEPAIIAKVNTNTACSIVALDPNACSSR